MKSKGLKTVHTSNSKKGMGDFYGTGIKQKVGRVIDGMGQKPLSSRKIKTPPKGLA